MHNFTHYSPFFSKTQFWLEYIQLSSWFKFSFQKLCELTLQLPVLTFPKQVSILTCFHFRINIKWGSGGERRRRRDQDFHQNTPWHRAGRLRRVTFGLASTFSLTQKKRSAEHDSATHEDAEGDACGFAGCSPGLGCRLSFHRDGLGRARSRRIRVSLCCCGISISTVHKLHPWALLLLLSPIYNSRFLSRTISEALPALSLSLKGKITHKIAAVSYVFLCPGGGKASSDHRTYSPCCL